MITNQIAIGECRFMSEMIINRIFAHSAVFCQSSAVAHEFLSRIIANEGITLIEAMDITRGMLIPGRVSMIDEMKATTEMITSGIISCDPCSMRVHVDPMLMLRARSFMESECVDAKKDNFNE